MKPPCTSSFQSKGPILPPYPPDGLDDDCYEEAEPFVPVSQPTGMMPGSLLVALQWWRVMQRTRSGLYFRNVDANVWLNVSGPDAVDSDSSHYESYGEEEEDSVKDKAHYIQWSASQPCLRSAPESRICGYLSRKKWLGQWKKQLFIIRNTALLVGTSSLSTVAAATPSCLGTSSVSLT